MKGELQEKEQQVKDLKGVIQQLESKITIKEKEVESEKNDKNRIKEKYEEAMDKIAKLEAQLEAGGVTAAKQPEKVETIVRLRPASQMMDIVDVKQLNDVKIDLKLILQQKNVPSHQLNNQLFKPYQRD